MSATIQKVIGNSVFQFVHGIVNKNELEGEKRMAINVSEQWDVVAEKMSKVTDRLGKPIDPGIFDTVVALNVLGFKTTMSCEGHANRGVAAPWIDIEPQNAARIKKQVSEVQRQKYPEGGSHPLTEEAKQLTSQIEQEQQKLLQQLISYLQQFYSDHQCEYDQIIIPAVMSTGRIRLQSIGASSNQQSEVAINLQKYQQEMIRFTNFMKNYVSR